MKNLINIFPGKTLILMAFLLGLIIILSFILFISKQKPSPSGPNPVISGSPSPVNFISPFQKTIIGKTSAQDIETKYDIQNKQLLDNGDIQYSIKSKLDARPDQIIAHDNLAQFERTITVGSSDPIKLTAQIIKLGPAEKAVKGSSFYGAHMDTYIYASKGLALIANTYADEVYEIQTFPPTSVDNYLNLYGTDIKETTTPVKENPE